MRAVRTALGAVLLSALAAACSTQSPSEAGAPTVVASTAGWGSVAAAVAGSHASVKSILTDPAADPHSFEATPADAAAITDASLVVYNGGGYDRWVDDVLTNRPDVDTVDAYSVAGGGDEHVFYDPVTVKAVADRIAERLSIIDAVHTRDYRNNAAAFGRQADTLADSERAIGRAHPGAAVVATEPVATYLLRTAGLTDRTPAGFAAAAEQGTDPSPADVAAVLDLVSSRKVAALLANPQTESAASRRLENSARQAGVPLVTVTETLPAGTDYLTWQRRTVDQLAAALAKR